MPIDINWQAVHVDIRVLDAIVATTDVMLVVGARGTLCGPLNPCLVICSVCDDDSSIAAIFTPNRPPISEAQAPQALFQNAQIHRSVKSVQEVDSNSR